MSILSARGLSKAYGPQTLFAGASLTIEAGQRVGLLGHNGTGKSTLLRVLAGLEPADEGVVEKQRGAAVRYLAQEPRFEGATTPHEIVLSGLSEWHAARGRHAEVSAAIEAGNTDAAVLAEQARLAESVERLGGWDQGHRAELMLERLGVRELDRDVSTMSGGERRRVALAQILVAQPALAILDEPTNHLDVATIEFLEQYLCETFQGAVLLVTHDRYVLDAVADRILELEHGVLREYDGGYTDYLEQKEMLLAHAARAEQNRLNRLRRERAWLLRGAKARTTKQKARIKRAEALIAIEAPREAPRVELEGLEASARPSGKSVLELHDLRLDLGERTLIAGLTLYLVQGERVGIVGPNGVGKTSLLKLVSGELAPTGGETKLGARTRIAYFDQARADLRDDWSVFDNVAGREGAQQSGGGHVQLGETTLELRAYLERFLFDGGKQRQKVLGLSGGERARVALAKALRDGANLLLLDEPTNDLDMSTLAELEELLVGWPGCMLVVSHDRAFLDRVATSVLAFEGEGAVVRYQGNYQSYLAQREHAVQVETRDARKSQPARADARAQLSPPPDLTRKALTYAERLELAGIVDAIAAAETALARYEAALSDPATYTAAADAQKGARQSYEQARAEVTRLTSRWEALEARAAVSKG